MAKDAYYFSHDSNAHDDPKCILLIDQLGLEGYGIYWLLIEILRDQNEYQYPLNLLPAIAKRYNTSSEKIASVIKVYGLFDNDEDYFWSPSLCTRMEKVDYLRSKASEAGKISAAKRLLNSGSTDVQQSLNNRLTKKRKEIKEKEKKEDKKKSYGEFNNVKLTDDEYLKLITTFGEQQTFDKIENLSQYIASKGKKYSSHYATILNWERKNTGGNNGANKYAEYDR